MERGVDCQMGRVIDPAGHGGVRGRPSCGANVSVSFLELPLDPAVAIDGIKKKQLHLTISQIASLAPAVLGFAPGSSMARGLIGLMKYGRYLGESLDQVHAVDGFHMREHFVDVGDPEANVPRPADIVRLPGGDFLPAGRIVKREQFQKQFLRLAKRNLQETNAHIDGVGILQKTRQSPRKPHILEVRKGLLNTRIEERLIEARHLLRDRAQRH